MSQSKMSQFAVSIFASLGATLLVAMVNAERQAPQPSFPRLCQDAPALFAGWRAFTQEKLRLRTDQQSAWQNFVQSARGALEPILQVCTEQVNLDPADLPAELALQETVASARLDALRALTPAVLQLWSELSPEQRQHLRLPTLAAPPAGLGPR
jgi:hypothetical protein